jgi:hypothetical protein
VINDRDLWQRFETIKIAKQQLQHLNTETWIEADPWRQARALYDLHQAQPKLALTMAEEISPGRGQVVFSEALYRGLHPEVQAVLYLEHRKRLALCLAATRCAASPPSVLEVFGSTPHSFNQMVEVVRDRAAWRLPACLQVYLLGFGGMICADRRDEELAWIAAQIGGSASEVAELLGIYESLFPFPDGGSWHVETEELSRLKLCPVPLRGAGLGMREALSGRDWPSLATAAQLRVCGSEHIDAAAEFAARARGV